MDTATKRSNNVRAAATIKDDQEKAFTSLMQAYHRFDEAVKELALARDNLNMKIETFKDKMPNAFELKMREF